jgi:hypothetical protein
MSWSSNGWQINESPDILGLHSIQVTKQSDPDGCSVASHLFQLAHFGSFPVWQFFPSFWVPDLRGPF